MGIAQNHARPDYLSKCSRASHDKQLILSLIDLPFLNPHPLQSHHRTSQTHEQNLHRSQLAIKHICQTAEHEYCISIVHRKQPVLNRIFLGNSNIFYVVNCSWDNLGGTVLIFGWIIGVPINAVTLQVKRGRPLWVSLLCVRLWGIKTPPNRTHGFSFRLPRALRTWLGRQYICPVKCSMVCDETSVTRSISGCLYLINELCALNVALCHTLGRQRYMQPSFILLFQPSLLLPMTSQKSPLRAWWGSDSILAVRLCNSKLQPWCWCVWRYLSRDDRHD
jgi:hypothetical protein